MSSSNIKKHHNYLQSTEKSKDDGLNQRQEEPMQDIKKIPECSSQVTTTTTRYNEESQMEKRERTDKDNDLDVYGNREGRHNKQKKIVINSSNNF